MATATTRKETVEVVKTEEKVVGVTLELTAEEAAYLKGIAGKTVQGHTAAGRAISGIYRALDAAKVESKRDFKLILNSQSLAFE